MDTSANKLLKEASKDLELLLELKILTVKLKDYELGAQCRQIELEKFPVTQEEIDAQEEAQNLQNVFRFVELNIDKSTCYRIAKTLELYKKKKGSFTLKDASKIIVDSQRLFIR